MKKFIAILISVLLLCGMTTAMAADEKVTVAIQPVDYQTGKAVSKTYVENELFNLRVDIDVPRFADLTNMQLVIEVDGVEIEEPSLQLVTGRYYIRGVVTAQPANICIKVKDVALENADTAEEMYEAVKEDRTVTACYSFTAGAQQTQQTISIPKTGDASVLGLAFILGAGAWIVDCGKRFKR